LYLPKKKNHGYCQKSKILVTVKKVCQHVQAKAIFMIEKRHRN